MTISETGVQSEESSISDVTEPVVVQKHDGEEEDVRLKLDQVKELSMKRSATERKLESLRFGNVEYIGKL